MSLSLSSLLNPSPDADAAPPPPPPPPPSNDSLPPIQYVQSPEQHSYQASPVSATLPPPHFTYPPVPEHDAVHALAALSGSSGHPPPHSPSQSQWYGQSARTSSYHRRSSSYEQRPGSSGYSEPIHLPPVQPNGMKPISPTLDYYHVPSRSPDRRRESVPQPGFTLAPFQGLGVDHTTRSPYNAESAADLRVGAHWPSPTTYDQQHALTSAPSSSTTMQPSPSQPIPPSSPHNLQATTSNLTAPDESGSSPAVIKQERTPTPRVSSTADLRHVSAQDAEPQSLKAVTSLKSEMTHSPLRESSLPLPSTETSAAEPTGSKKRPAPSKTKKGTATATTKKAPPAKKRKLDLKRSVTPSSRASKSLILQTGSSKGTPAQSSPPSTRSQSADPDDEPYEEDEDAESGDMDADGDVYCICRKPDNGTFMIGCDGTCDDWFHGKCVGIEERDKNLIDKYICPNCTKADAGKTTWKRICRRGGCRQPARVGKTKGGKEGSKYCSEECGVLYFRDMLARTRGREDMSKQRSSRRKSSMASHERPSIDYDLGARGGTLAAGELKSLVNTSKTADDFKKLGEGVLSPPATPTDASTSPNGTSHETNKHLSLTESEAAGLAEIAKKKDAARAKHALLKDRMKLITMVKQAAVAAALEREMKTKEFCGYDSRLEWSDGQFSAWRESRAGRTAFDLETLAVENSAGAASGTKQPNGTGEGAEAAAEDADFMELEVELDYEICDRKKCARHLEWAKLAVDDVRFEMSDNGDAMRLMEKEEKEIRVRAALRAKEDVGREGRVEVHGLGIVATGLQGHGKGREVVESVEAPSA